MSSKLTQFLGIKMQSNGSLEIVFRTKSDPPSEDTQPLLARNMQAFDNKLCHKDFKAAFDRLKIHVLRLTGQLGPLVNMPPDRLERPKGTGESPDAFDEWMRNAEFFEGLLKRTKINSITWAKGDREQIKIMGQVTEVITSQTIALNSPLIDLQAAKYIYLDELQADILEVTRETLDYINGKYTDMQGNLFEVGSNPEQLLLPPSTDPDSEEPKAQEPPTVDQVADYIVDFGAENFFGNKVEVAERFVKHHTKKGWPKDWKAEVREWLRILDEGKKPETAKKSKAKPEESEVQNG